MKMCMNIKTESINLSYLHALLWKYIIHLTYVGFFKHIMYIKRALSVFKNICNYKYKANQIQNTFVKKSKILPKNIMYRRFIHYKTCLLVNYWYESTSSPMTMRVVSPKISNATCDDFSYPLNLDFVYIKPTILNISCSFTKNLNSILQNN